MKRLLPFIFPLTSLLIVIFLAFRWYDNRTDRGSITPFAGDVMIEELSQAEVNSSLRGVGDYKSVALVGEGETKGEVRYEVAEGKVKFSVMTNLPEAAGATYQVWLKDPSSAAVKKAFPLESLKGGMMGTAAIDESALPFEIVVSKDDAGALVPTQVLLKGLLDQAE